MKYYITSKISENIHETPEGYLVCVGVPIARTGEMVYAEGETPLEVGDDGRVIIHRSEDEVFRLETMASFEGKAVTITHPIDFVNPDNWSKLAKGVLQNVRRGEGEEINDLIADLLITDSVAIGLVKSGLREVSCGYEAEYTQTTKGRGVQTSIVGNHLALVDEGRAGSAYAINDHKGKGTKIMSIKAKIKAIMGKAQDDALALVTDEAGAEKKEEKKEEKKDDKKEEAKDAPTVAFDELKKMVGDLGAKIEGMMKPAADEKKDDEKKDESKEESKDESKEESKDEEVAPGLEDLVKQLTARVAALEERLSDDGEGSEESEDADGEEGSEEESEDDDFDESTMTGDTASRVEILAPGLKLTKDAKAAALKVAYATVDGKKAIDALTGGKAPVLTSPEKTDALFVAASELLKVSRTKSLSETKAGKGRDSAAQAPVTMTAEQMNEINAKHYGRK